MNMSSERGRFCCTLDPGGGVRWGVGREGPVSATECDVCRVPAEFFVRVGNSLSARGAECGPFI